MQPARVHAPGPRPLPVIGNILEFRDGGLLFSYIRHMRRWGHAIRYRFGPLQVLAISHPEAIRYVTIKNKANYSKGQGVAPLRWLTGQGLFTADGALWQTQRRMMQPQFTVAATRNYGPAMLAAIKEVADRLEATPPGAEVDLSFEMMRFTMDVICRTMFSESVAEGASRLSAAIAETLHWIGVRGLQLLRRGGQLHPGGGILIDLLLHVPKLLRQREQQLQQLLAIDGDGRGAGVGRGKEPEQGKEGRYPGCLQERQ